MTPFLRSSSHLLQSSNWRRCFCNQHNSRQQPQHQIFLNHIFFFFFFFFKLGCHFATRLENSTMGSILPLSAGGYWHSFTYFFFSFWCSWRTTHLTHSSYVEISIGLTHITELTGSLERINMSWVYFCVPSLCPLLLLFSSPPCLLSSQHVLTFSITPSSLHDIQPAKHHCASCVYTSPDCHGMTKRGGRWEGRGKGDWQACVMSFKGRLSWS